MITLSADAKALAMTLKSTFMAAVATTALLSLAGPAVGVKWYSASSPLYVKENGVKQGKAYGNFYNKRSTWAESSSKYADSRPGGDAVRVETDYWWFGQNYSKCGTQGGSCWWQYTSRQSGKTNSGSWQSHTTGLQLNAAASKARGSIDICEIQAWSNDPCSAKATPTFNY